MRGRVLIVVVGLLLAGAVVLASRGQYDPFVGTWSPTDSQVAQEITSLDVARTQAGYEETMTYPSGKTSSFNMKRPEINLLITLAAPIQGGFALWYYPKTDRLGLVQGGGAPPVYFDKSN